MSDMSFTAAFAYLDNAVRKLQEAQGIQQLVWVKLEEAETGQRAVGDKIDEARNELKMVNMLGNIPGINNLLEQMQILEDFAHRSVILKIQAARHEAHEEMMGRMNLMKAHIEEVKGN